jgi:energy-coupling factor transport system ATP-binding protein
VLSGIDLELRRGEVGAVVGANGSGKSTLLACLAGLETPLDGEVDGPRPGMVFQNPEHQFVAATVRAELAYGLPADAAAEVDAMLRRFRLEEIAGYNPFRLSGGQKRRVSLAAMLLHDRPYLFADEPGLGLDRPATTEAMRALREAARQGRGVLLTSHDLRAVAGYADRVIVLGGGRMLADTTPLRLLRRPELLAEAGLRPPALLRRLASLVDDDAALGGVLRELDTRAAGLRIGVAP